MKVGATLGKEKQRSSEIMKKNNFDKITYEASKHLIRFSTDVSPWLGEQVVL
jgi:hypothetical protein